MLSINITIGANTAKFQEAITNLQQTVAQTAEKISDSFKSVGKAIEQIEEAAFTDDELYIYDRFWDMVSTAKMQITSSRKDGMRKGLKEGMEKGMEKGMKEGMEKGIEKGIGEERIRTARKMKAEGLGTDMITKITGLTPNDIDAL